ncbi:pentatricopeptide repeat-containing protein [Quercus suber]|uniref:Pentatricopeptide repeat-containing protein n=1 Tax=Quercus suber TaxID=58331 RepID=A0AAW0KDW1_QUESU
MGTNTNTITLNLNLNLKLSPTRAKTKILCKNNSAFEENKQVSVDYDEGKHEVSTRLTGLRKADIQRRYRLRVEADRFQRDWTLSEVVHEILSLRPHHDIEGVLNRWIGRFARKNFPLLIRVMSLTTADREREGVSDTLVALSKGPYIYFVDAGMGKKRRLPLIDVGAGPARSQQRGEENLEAAHTTPHARADAPDAGTTPPGLRRDFPLTVIEVGDGSSRSRDRVEEDLRAAFAADHTLGDASDDDETQPPSQESLVQQTQETSNVRAENVGQATPGSSNGTKKRGNTLMRKIWALPADKKIQLPLNAAFQPLGESGQTFVRWLGTFCICHVYCPLMPLNWAHVPPECKANAWTEIQKKWEIHPEVLPPANQMSWAMHLLGELRRNRRTKLKQKLYTEGATKEEVLAKIPAWAEPQQFADLVDYWFDPKTETLVNNNKRSRSFQKDIARSGPISFAQIADNMAKDSGQAVERAVLFQKVYSKKDGTPVSTDVGAKIVSLIVLYFFHILGMNCACSE